MTKAKILIFETETLSRLQPFSLQHTGIKKGLNGQRLRYLLDKEIEDISGHIDKNALGR